MNDREFELQTELSIAKERNIAYVNTITSLTADIAYYKEVLKGIGDFAGQRSSGPELSDAMWDIRTMAYDAI